MKLCFFVVIFYVKITMEVVCLPNKNNKADNKAACDSFKNDWTTNSDIQILI